MKRRTGYLVKRGSIFYAAWKVDGKRFMQTTGKRTRRKAEVELRRIMEPFAAGDEVAVLESIGARIEGRKAEIARYEDEHNPPLSIRQAWHAFETAGNRREISPGTLRNYEGYWRTLREWLEKKHPEARALRDVTFPICEAYVSHLVKRGLTGRTINAHRSFFSVFWNTLATKARCSEEWTLRDGRKTLNPWAAIQKRVENSMSRRPFTVEELKRICGAAEGELRTLFALGLYLGCRLGDAACMEWGSVDLARGRIQYVPRKTARQRKKREALLIPLHPELHGILSETPPQSRKGYVIPDMARRYREKGQAPVSAIVQRHFLACGVTTTGEREGAGVRRRVEAGFHSLRHTAVSLLRDAGAAQSVSMALVGHNSPEVHQLYTHQDEASLRRAVHALPAVLSGETRPALPPAPDAALREKIGALAAGLNSKTWRTVRSELETLASGRAEA